MLLSGCSSRVEDEIWTAAREAAKERAHVVAFRPDTRFCQSVARQQIPSSVDNMTQSRMYADNYRQCVIINAVNDSGLRVADMGGGTVPY